MGFQRIAKRGGDFHRLPLILILLVGLTPGYAGSEETIPFVEDWEDGQMIHFTPTRSSADAPILLSFWHWFSTYDDDD
jgi:hypothetical protein